jgi:mRNA interferase RelE/StbE
VYQVKLSKEAAKYYRKIDKPTRGRIDEALDAIGDDPFDREHHDIKSLHGPLKGLWRYRVGTLRIVYRVNREAKEIQIATIRPRGKAY